MSSIIWIIIIVVIIYMRKNKREAKEEAARQQNMQTQRVTQPPANTKSARRRANMESANATGVSGFTTKEEARIARAKAKAAKAKNKASATAAKANTKKNKVSNGSKAANYYKSENNTIHSELHGGHIHEDGNILCRANIDSEAQEIVDKPSMLGTTEDLIACGYDGSEFLRSIMGEDFF